jgi:hypothetical protein
MLHQIDEALEALLRASVPLSATDIDVSFEAPDREWSSKLNRPTVNLFLWDIRLNTDRARSGMETIERDGVPMRRLALPRVALRYLVTAWTSDHRDERALLAGLLRSVLAHPVIATDFLPPALLELHPPVMSLVAGDKTQIDIFKTLEGQLKPGLDVIVTVEVDLGLEKELAQPPSSVDLLTSPPGSEPVALRRVAGEVMVPDSVGLTVVSPRGSSVVNAAGRFLVPAVPGDEVSLLSDPIRTVVVPEHGGVVIR